MRHRALVPLVALAVSIVGGETAQAQTFFEKLFGLGSPSPTQRVAPNRLGVPAHIAPHSNPGSLGLSSPMPLRRLRSFDRDGDDGRDDIGGRDGRSEEGKGEFQTFCVRTCDGYYFPISRAVPRSRFHRDASACTARCGEESRLFYGPTDTDDKAALVDLTGRSYGDMPTAFKYRKTLVAGCSCRPMPWSEAELQRHQSYALADEEKKAGASTAGGGSVRTARTAYALPPPVSGPGVVVMSATQDIVEGAADEPAKVPPAAAEATKGEPSAGAIASAREPDAASDAEETARPGPAPTLRRLHRRGPAVAILNAAKAGEARLPARVVRHERANRRDRRLRHAAVQMRPPFAGQPRYVYPVAAR